MRRLVIAIDCDDVLLPTTEFIVNQYNRLHGAVVLLENAHMSNNPEWQADKSETHRRIDQIQLSDQYALQLPADDTIAAVRHLAQSHELHLVTARPESIMPVTRAMLDTYFAGCFQTVEHLGPDVAKGSVCQRLASDILIDDSLRNLEDARRCGVEGLVWFGNYAWQRESDTPLAGMVRCHAWTDVLREVQRLATTN